MVAQPQLRGDEYLADLGAPVIFAANHASHIDTPLLLACLPLRFRHRTVVAAAADYFFDRRWKADAFSFLLGAIPIERTKVNRRSADLAAELLADDWNLVIFPEGGRSPDGWAQQFRGGAAYLAARTGRPVVPVHLDGTRHILPKGGGMVRRTRTTVTFGTPLWPAEGEDARRFGERIEAAVATLANEATTDWWTARKLAASRRDAVVAGSRRRRLAPGLGARPRPRPTRGDRRRGQRLAPHLGAETEPGPSALSAGPRTVDPGGRPSTRKARRRRCTPATGTGTAVTGTRGSGS